MEPRLVPNQLPDIRKLLTKAPVIPVVRIERSEDAVPMAKALVEGGLPVIEITLRTPPALNAIEAVARNVPDALVGAGTVTQPGALAQARDAGAAFAVSPGATPALLAAARAGPLPFIPGIMTPGEAMRALEAGFDALKLFPAEQAGGVGMLKAMAGPFPQIAFCPTGGVSAANMAAYLTQPNVLCVGGSWLVPTDALARRDWALVSRLAAAAVREAALIYEGTPAPATAGDRDPGAQSALGEEDPGATL